MDPGQLALIPVTFVEDRAGRALVRLLNGSKTSIDYDALNVRPALAHFTRSSDGPGVTFVCTLCGAAQECGDWSGALSAAEGHYGAEHRDAGGN